jgi:hypothetical protein
MATTVHRHYFTDENGYQCHRDYVPGSHELDKALEVFGGYAISTSIDQPRTYHSDALGAVTISEDDPIERDGHAFRNEGDMEAWDLYGGDEDDA